MDNYLYYLSIFSIGAFIAPIVSKKIGIPTIIGEILYGILLSFIFVNLDFKDDGKIITFLSELGFIFLFFLAGMELNFDAWKFDKLYLPLFALALFYFFAFLTWRIIFPEYSSFIMVILTASSIGVLFLTLKSHYLEKKNYGQTLILSESLAEISSIFLLIFYSIYITEKNNFVYGLIWAILKLIILFLIISFLLFVLSRYFWRKPSFLKLIINSHTNVIHSELVTRFLILILFLIVAVNTFLNFKLILGSFLAGIFIAILFKDKRYFEHKLSSIGYGFVIPIFFIKVGYDFGEKLVNFENILKQSLILYLCILFIRSFLVIPLLSSLKGVSLKIKTLNLIAGGFALSAPLTLLVTSAQMGYNMQILTLQNYQSIVLCAMIGGLCGPLGFSIFYKDIK